MIVTISKAYFGIRAIQNPTTSVSSHAFCPALNTAVRATTPRLGTHLISRHPINDHTEMFRDIIWVQTHTHDDTSRVHFWLGFSSGFFQGFVFRSGCLNIILKLSIPSHHQRRM